MQNHHVVNPPNLTYPFGRWNQVEDVLKLGVLNSAQFSIFPVDNPLSFPAPILHVRYREVVSA